MALHSPPPPAPPKDLFQWTDGLRSLISPLNAASHASDSVPIPTNEWWGNLLAWDASQSRDSDPIFANPYVYHIAQQRGLSVAYLHDYRVDGPLNENGAIKYYFYPATVKNLIFSASEWTTTAGSGLALQIESWDDLGVTIQLAAATGSSASIQPQQTSSAQLLRGYLSMGNAFTTLEYHGQLHAQVQSDHGILQVNGHPYEEGGVIDSNGASFEVLYNNGHKWILFFFPEHKTTSSTSSSASTETTTIKLVMQQNKLTTTEPFDGVVQAAYVSSQASRSQQQQQHHDEDSDQKVLALYRDVAGVFPTGATLFTESDGDAFGFDWTLQRVARSPTTSCNAETTTHLHFALTHLQQMMDPAYVIRKTELVLWSHTRGAMQAYVLRSGNGSTGTKKWRFVVPRELSNRIDTQATAFVPPSIVPGHIVDQLHLVEIVTQEIMETDWNKDLPPAGSYYFKGKALQKFATMVLVAKKLSQTTSPSLQPVVEKGIAQLKAHLLQFAQNKHNTYPLVYDTVYKGIITSETLAKKDLQVDFGNGAYNDHHYHYGYLITAVAILIHVDPQYSPNHPEYAKMRDFIDFLIRDVANSDAKDPFFPKFRLFNWFLGHSYSHGVTPMADGKDEESTSEEVNFLYGMALYHHVTQGEQSSLARLMLKVNALAIETYFLIENDKIGQIHPPKFGKNKVTGICFDNKCDYTTWFNPARECIHGIQMIPVSPMLDAVRTKQFLQEEWHEILANLDCVVHWDQPKYSSGWTSLLFSNAAVLMPQKACEVLATCPMDDGLSRAWALYMAATKLPPS